MPTITWSLRQLLSIAILFLVVFITHGQSQPLQIVLQSSAERMPLLSEDYIMQSNDLFLVVNSVENRKRRFAIIVTVTGGSISIVSNGYGRRQSINPFETRTLSNYDLAEYFDIDNLIFKGYSKEDYLLNGGLPSGTYDICIELYDATNDRGIPLSNASCFTKSVELRSVPVITTPSDLEIVDSQGFSVDWLHSEGVGKQLEYEIYLYDYDPNLSVDEHKIMAKPIVLGQDKSMLNSKMLLPKKLKLVNGRVYLFFVKVIGVNNGYLNDGFSKGVLVQISEQLKSTCNGEVEFQEVPSSNNEYNLLYATVEGCGTPTYDWNGLYIENSQIPYRPMYDENHGFTVTIVCDDGCSYTGEYGNQNCVVGAPCDDGDDCTLDDIVRSDCDCRGTPEQLSFSENSSVNGTTYTPLINCSNPQYLWSDGSVSSHLTVSNGSNSGYNVTVTCEGDCIYTGTIIPRSWVCTTGGICDDGNICTINDEYDENCGCAGVGSCQVNPPCTGYIDTNIGQTLDGFYLVTASFDCDMTDVEWYQNDALIQSNVNTILVQNLDNLYVVIKCSSGCVYSKNFMGNCIQGSSCDDGSSCTINDSIDGNCNCTGQQTGIDSDGDGVCDADDLCMGFDDNIDSDGDGIPDCLDDCIESLSYCDYSIDIPKRKECSLLGISIYDPITQTQHIFSSINNDGIFHFPYNISVGGFTALTPFNQFEIHLSNWITQNNFSGAVNSNLINEVFEVDVTGTELELRQVRMKCDGQTYLLDWSQDNCDVELNDACDDGNDCTTFDTYDENCNCIGVPISEDFILTLELNESLNEISATIGCENTTYLWSDGSTNQSTIYIPGVYYSVTVTCGQESNVSCVFEGEYNNDEHSCLQGSPCEGACLGMIYDFNCNCVPSQEYVIIELVDIGENENVNYQLTPVVDCENATYLWSNGAVSSTILVIEPIGTYFVEIVCDGCVYLGTYHGECIINSPCDDSDPCTINDVIDDNCNCVGNDIDENCESVSECSGSVTISSEIYDEGLIKLSAQSTCDVSTYQWSNGSILPIIIVPANLETYTVIVYCEDSDCIYQTSYQGETSYCTPGDHCDDNDPCTIDDVYMINCECIGIPIDASLNVDIAPITVSVCDYLWSDISNDMDGYRYIEKIELILPDNTIFVLDPSFNDDGFDFPYCNANQNGDFCQDASTLEDLVDHLNEWIIDSGYLGEVTFEKFTSFVPPGVWWTRSNIIVKDSNIEFLFTTSFTSIQSNRIKNFNSSNCDEQGAEIGYEYSANINRDCDNITYLWSNGAVSSSVSLSSSSACINVTLTCDNCVYQYEVEGANCEDCIVGTPCEPEIGCEGMIDVNCNCITTSSSDIDGDGVCDEDDICPGLNDNLYPNGCDQLDCTQLEVKIESVIEVNEITEEDQEEILRHRVIINNCNAATYLWSNGSTASSIVVPSHLGLYQVTVTCGECIEVFSFGDETNCDLGLVGSVCYLDENCFTNTTGYVDAYCNCIGEPKITYYMDSDDDGIPDCMDDCDFDLGTELDEYGDPICCDSPPTLEYSQSFVQVYDNCIDLSGEYNTIENIYLIDGTTEIKLSSIEGFNFPYCIATGCVALGGGPIEDFTPPTELDLLTKLVRDLVKWGGREGKYFQALIYDEEEASESDCGISGLHISLKGFPYELGRVITNDGNASFSNSDPYDGESKYTLNLIPHEDCEMESIVWSDGESWSRIDGGGIVPLTKGPLYSEHVGYRATITCANGCIYDIESPDANCFVGDPCIPNLACANNGVQVPGPYGCLCVEDVNNLTYITDEEGEVILYENNDSDGDGVCDENDVCDGFDDNIDTDGDGIPDCLDECKTDCISQVSILPEKPENYIPSYYLLNELEISYYVDGELIGPMDLTNMSEFSFPYTFCDNGCDEIDPSGFINDFDAWATLEGLTLSIGTINLTESNNELTLHFINSDVLITDIWHQMYGTLDGNSFFLGRFSIRPPSDCYPSTCCYVASKRIADCSMLNDIIVIHNGQERSLFNWLNLGSYSIDKLFNFSLNCTQNSSSINDLIEDLGNEGIEITAERIGQELIINLCSERFEFKSLVWDQDVETESNGNLEILIDLEEECTHPCDDGDPCTINDHFVTLPNGACHCEGTYTDTDGDGICDEIDECDEYPDQYDIDGDGVADICGGPTVSCNNVDYNYANYFLKKIAAPPSGEDGQECAHVHNDDNPEDHYFLFNDMRTWQEDFKERFGVVNSNGSWTPPAAFDGFPFPKLIEDLVGDVDTDDDGIVDFIDIVPGVSERYPEYIEKEKARDFGPEENIKKALLNGVHEVQPMRKGFQNAQDIIDLYYTTLDESYKDAAFREIKRFSLWNQILFNDYTTFSDYGSTLGINLPGGLTPSPCFASEEIQLPWGDDGYLDPTQVNGNGWIKHPDSGCWMEVEVDCDCNCNIIYHDADGDGNCNGTEVIGTTCTDDPTEADPALGIEYIQCPPSSPDACFIYGLVSNPDYNPYDEEGNYIVGYDVPSCNCEPLNADTNGNPYDQDNDGVCDELDVCEGPDQDDDGDGVKDCIDKCLGLDNATLQAYAIDPDYPPTGPGDPCDDGNPCTYDDVITEECGCSGVYVDTDHDGVYDCEECDVENFLANIVFDIYGNALVSTSIWVDDKGRDVGEGHPDAIAQWTGCDLCPGLDDRLYTGPKGLDENGNPIPAGVYDDYDDDGLPDCIDPPWKEICPDDFEITEDGLVLIFNTDDLDASDYPEPITFQGITTNNQLINIEYLIVAFARELEGGTTEVLYELDLGNNTAGDFNIANIIYSDHQVCDLINSEVVSLPCPEEINDNQLIFNHQYVDFDISDLIGDFVINGESFSADLNNYDVYNSEMELNVPSEFGLNPNFTGTIELPNGLICTYDVGEIDECQAVLITGQTVEVVPGDPCDDGDDCTHHDKFLTTTEGNCECQGEERPDTDEDGLCDEIDPCPEDFNADLDGDGIGDLDQCPCGELILNDQISDNPVLTNGTDLEVYLQDNLDLFDEIIVTVDDLNLEVYTINSAVTSPVVISNLTSGMYYAITITGICIQVEDDPNTTDIDESVSSESSITIEVDVPFSNDPIACVDDFLDVEISNLNLLSYLNKGDEFQASDFTVKVRNVEGGSGKYSGSGYIKAPYFNFIRLNAEFEDITITASRQMVDGVIIVKGVGLAIFGDDVSDAINGEIDNIINVLEDIEDILEVITTVLEEIEDFYNSIEGLVTDANRDCYEAAMEDLNDLIADAVAGDPDVSAQNIKDQMQVVKDCLNQAETDANENITNVKDLLIYSFGQISQECSTDDLATDYIDQMDFTHENSMQLAQDLFQPFENATSVGSDLIPSSLGIVEFEDYSIESNQDILESIDNINEILAHYEREKLFLLCFVSKVYTDNNGLDQDDSEDVLESILNTMIAADYDLVAKFSSDLTNSTTAATIYQIEENREFIKSAIANAIAHRMYSN